MRGTCEVREGREVRGREGGGVNLGGGVRGARCRGRNVKGEGRGKGCEVEVGLIASTSSSLCRNSHVRIIY